MSCNDSDDSAGCEGVVDLPRGDRNYVSWPVTGLSIAAVADVSLEAGPWWSLAVTPGVVTGYFAGPDLPSPGSAHPVPVTSHAVLRVVDGPRSATFDGGFIRLVP